MASVPLTEAQEGLWYSQALAPANPIFNTGQYLDLRGPLDLAAFGEAVNRASAEAAALSLRFAEGPDGPVQLRDPDLSPRLRLVDVSHEADPQGAALAAIRRDMNTPVNLTRGPLAAQLLFRLGPERHFWAQRIHHLATDGYGMVLLTTRISELYAALLANRETGGRPLGSLESVWAEDADYRAGAKRGRDAAFWHEAMSGLETVGGMAQGRPVSAHSFLRFERPMAGDVREALIALAKRAEANWPDVLTALVSAYCARFVESGEVVVGVPHMGRFGSASARVPAMVMNVLPLRIAPDDEAPLDGWLAAVAGTLQKARGHGRYRSEQLRRDLGLLGGDRRLYGPLVNVQPYDRPPRLAGLDVTLHVTGTGPVEDIHFTFRGDAARGLTLEVDANPNLYNQSAVFAHGERLAAFLANAVKAERLGDVPTATPEEQKAELEAHNATAHPLPASTLAELIERTMAGRPDAPALRFNSETLDYAELDRRTVALAGALRERGAKAGSVIAVALPRSTELVVALVAVLRAGAAYLPLDLDHPPARLSAILANAKPLAVLAQGDPHGVYGERLLLPADWPDAAPVDLPLPQLADPAYVIYTSGSTGQPKGVVVSHRAIVNRLLWMQDQYAIGTADRILQKTPATFDVSVWEFFLPLIVGGTLVVAPPGAHRDPAAIARLIRSEGITAVHFVPSMLSAFLREPETRGLAVQRVFCSGEELAADLRDRFHETMRGELHNLYGPTEAAVDVSYWEAGPRDSSRPVPIGYAVWNTRLILLDEHDRPVPQGLAGHLHIGGLQLAEGYLGRPDLTAERFIADPFHEGERLYRTGDLARRRADGAITFLGRADQQVKIRGLRIELGEIEAAAAETGMVRSVAVLEREGRLAAYVVPTARDYGRAALRDALAARLPDYMVPSAIVELGELPVTANGKLDRKALPPPSFESGGGAAPVTETERRLATLFAELLKVEGEIGREDDFFALGGDSLTAVALMLRIRETWGADPGLAALFEHPQVAALAASIDAGGASDDAGLGPLITLARGDGALPPLFMVHPAGGICWGYRTLASALEPQRTVIGLQAPGLDLAAPLPESIEALARQYAARIADAWPDGPVHLAGWSVGGIIAQAVAVELAATGREVGMVAMLDAYPAECWRDEPEPTETEALRALLAIAGYDPEGHPELVTREQIVRFLRDGDSPLGNLPARVQDGVIRVVLDTNRLVRGHQHRHFGGRLIHVRAAGDHADKPQLVPELWMEHAAALERVDVPFLHSQLTGPEASALIAPALSAAMAAQEMVSA